MRGMSWKLLLLAMITGLISACAPSVPTTVPTKPAVAAPAAPAAGTATPTAAAKPAGATPTPAAKIKRGGTLNYAGNFELNSWDPILHVAGYQQQELPVLETLMNYVLVDAATGKHELRPLLAESWEVTDPKTVTVKLRKGVKFHDGSDFTAEVAKWNLERARDNPNSRSKRLVAIVDTIEVVDPLTIRLKLTQPSATVLLNLTSATGGSGANGTSMVSKAAADKNGEEILGTKPPATGPMMIVDWKKDDRTTLKKFDGYWGKGEDGQPLPYLDGITSRIIADPTVLFTEMRSGTVDASPHLASSDYQAAKANPNLSVQVLSWTNEFHLFGFNQKTPLWQNLKLRQAAQYAVDRKSIAAAVGFGLAEPNFHWFWGPGFVGYDTSLPHYEFDLEKARQLVKDAGYPDGVDTEILAYPQPVFSKPAEILQQMWAQAGIRAKINLVEMVAARAKTKIGEFQIETDRGSPSPDPAYMARLFTCTGAANTWNYCNPDMDKCMAEGEASYDPAQREQTYKRCQQIFYEDAYLGGLHRINQYVTWRKEVKGIALKFGWMDLHEAWLDK